MWHVCQLAAKFIDKPGVWYRTQKEHWLGWLKEYGGPGAYGRKTRQKRDAQYAYNHVVNYQMLLWLVKAAGVNPRRFSAARQASEKATTLQAKSAAIRGHIPWQVVAAALWGKAAV